MGDRAKKPLPSRRRLDVQGLRAVAVIAVILYHAGFPFPGGFAGVDIFFVISGFVICQSVIDEAAKRGSLDLRNFFWKRFRRLAPALGVVVIVSSVVSFLVLDQHNI